MTLPELAIYVASVELPKEESGRCRYEAKLLWLDEHEVRDPDCRDAVMQLFAAADRPRIERTNQALERQAEEVRRMQLQRSLRR